MSRNKSSGHLPLFGVGPVIVYGQVLITIAAVIVVNKLNLNAGRFEFLSSDKAEILLSSSSTLRI